MNSIKEIMKNQFELITTKILPVECYVLYWCYWVHTSEILTQEHVSVVTGNTSKTIRKYNDVLKELGLVKFKIVRKRGITGFRAVPLKIDTVVMERLKQFSENQNIKNNEKNVRYLGLAKLLYEEHKKHDENYLAGQNLTKTFERWANSIRLLIEKDRRDFEIVSEVIKWCQSPGNFWIPNILSGKTLRDKFAMLYAQYMQVSVRRKKINPHKKIKTKKFTGSDVKGLLNEL